MNRFFTLFFILIVVFGCGSLETPGSNTSLKIVGIPASQVTLIQPQLMDDPIDLVSVEKHRKKISYSLDLSQPVQLTLLSPVRINLLINPRDSLVLNLSKSQPEFSGIGAERQIAYYEFNRQLAQLSGDKEDPISLSRKLNVDEFKKEILLRDKEANKVALDILQSQPNDQLLSSWIKLTTQFIKANSLASYIQMRDEQDTNELVKIIDEMLPLDPSVLLLTQYVSQWTTIAQAIYVNKTLYDRGYYDESENMLMAEIVGFEVDTTLRQLMMAAQLAKQLSSMDTSLYGNYRSAIETHLTIPELRTRIQTMYHEASGQIASSNYHLKDAYSGEFDVRGVIESIKKTNKGKIIYLDIWATWCKPCLAEFKESKAFKAQFEGEDISYVYICAQSPRQESWKALINKFDLKGTHLYLSEEQFSEFTEIFPVGYFPSYYILDKNGNTVNNEANLSPSNPQTTKKIMGLL